MTKHDQEIRKNPKLRKTQQNSKNRSKSGMSAKTQVRRSSADTGKKKKRIQKKQKLNHKYQVWKYISLLFLVLYLAGVVWLAGKNSMLFTAGTEKKTLFGSVTFLFLFLPFFLLVYFIIPLRFKNGILLIGSLLFYAWGEPVYVLLLLLIAWFHYLSGRDIWEKRSDPVKMENGVLQVVIVDILLLVFCRYTNLIVESLNRILPVKFSFPLKEAPLGMAVYMLIAIGYIVDLYRGKTRMLPHFSELLLYLSMFPQLGAGLVGRCKELELQMAERRFSVTRFGDGAMFFIRGLGKSVILAGLAGNAMDRILGMRPGGVAVLTAWFGCIIFAFKIYYLLSGYSDMAIGIGRMLGFELKKNFDYPYTSQSITEFSEKWYLSLASWFREYLLLPMGGTQGKKGKTIRNILIVWALTGLWYGASWKFLVWGLYIGILLLLEKYILNKWLIRIPPVFRSLYVWIMLLIGWIFFFSQDLGGAMHYLGLLVGIGASVFADTQTVYLVYTNWLFLLLASAGCTTLGYQLLQRLMYNMRTQKVRNVMAGVVYGAIFLISAAFLVI